MNLEIARIFYEMADILEMQNVEWKPRAYRKAAKAIESLPIEVDEIYKKEGIDGLKKIPGVGERLAKKIEEYIKTGKISEYEELKKSLPRGLEKLLEIPGLGPKKIMVLYKKLGVKSIEDLKRVIEEGKVARLPGFGEKSQENILRGIEIFERGQERLLLSTAINISNEIINELKSVGGVEKIEAVGSLRRMKETVGDIDILVVAKDPMKVMNKFTSLKNVERVLAKGEKKSMVILSGNIQADVRVFNKDEFGAALQYFTGNKEHNIELRKIAISKGYKLNEYGLFKGNKKIAGEDEKKIYEILVSNYIPPELRENRGEIKAAIENKLPKLVEMKDIKGDFHVHTKYSDGDDTIEEIARAAMKNYEFINICDHSKSQHVANGMEEERLLKQIDEIKSLRKKLKFNIFAGCEVDILKNGELDYEDEILKKLDIVTVAVHSGFKMSEKEMTERIITALNNKHVKIFTHPSGRLINKRLPYQVNMEKIFEVAKKNKIALEIDAFPDRLDLTDVNVKLAKEMGIKITIGTDAHSATQLHYMNLGVAVARRGWAEKKDIINCWEIEKIKEYFGISS
ncbi:MAG: DNA polymerase/3'-5' exonuclease PolX [Candidatus Micrarchaeia archaeon]